MTPFACPRIEPPTPVQRPGRRLKRVSFSGRKRHWRTRSTRRRIAGGPLGADPCCLHFTVSIRESNISMLGGSISNQTIGPFRFAGRVQRSITTAGPLPRQPFVAVKPNIHPALLQPSQREIANLWYRIALRVTALAGA